MMNAGRELDALVMEHVMGYGEEIPYHSTDIEAAMEVANTFKEFQMLKIHMPHPGSLDPHYVVSFKRGCEYSASTIPLAICLAALTAKGVHV